MKTKLIAAAAGITAIGAAALLATPYYFGGRAQATLDEQYRLLQSGGFLEIESRTYDRGWFSATETLTVRLKPSLLHNTQNYLPDNLKTVLRDPITITNHIQHGPFADGLVPIAAKVDSTFRYSEASERVLRRFFGEQAPVSMSNVIALNGSGRLNIGVPAFEYEELSGIKLNWKGLSGQTEYSRGWESFQHHYLAPSLAVKLADKGDILLENFSFDSDSHPGSQQITLGSSSAKVGRFSVRWQEGMDYNIKLNDIVNLVSNLQIGAFINPTGTIAPSSISVDNLSFDTQTSEQEQWINSEGRFRFDKLQYGRDTYGPLDIDVAAEHLEAKSLLAVKNKMAELAATDMSDEAIRNALLQTVKNEASGLFTNNPVINLRRFDFALPSGRIQAKGTLGFQGLSRADLNDTAALIKKTRADFDLMLPKPFLEELAVNQARNIFSVNPEDEAAGLASLDDIDETLRLMVDGTISNMQQQGYLIVSDGKVGTRLQWGDGSLKLNGKVFEIEPDPQFTEADMLPEAAASEASAPQNSGASAP